MLIALFSFLYDFVLIFSAFDHQNWKARKTQMRWALPRKATSYEYSKKVIVEVQGNKILLTITKLGLGYKPRAITYAFSYIYYILNFLSSNNIFIRVRKFGYRKLCTQNLIKEKKSSLENKDTSYNIFYSHSKSLHVIESRVRHWIP